MEDNKLTKLDTMVHEVFSKTGELKHLAVFENNEDFFNFNFEGTPYDALVASENGSYSIKSEYIKFNNFDNLESLTGDEYEKLLLENEETILEYYHKTF